jgi:hypothetical protein
MLPPARRFSEFMSLAMDEFWDPNDWEDFVQGLLQDRHGALNVQKVPARHKGDHGLDYYCHGDQAVYQCYAVQEPCDVAARAANQKKKITQDLKKLCKDSPTLRSLFQRAPVKRWILTVPLHDSADVNQHLARQTTFVRSKQLSYIAPDFEALIQDLTAFPRASREQRFLQAGELTIGSRSPTTTDIQAWTQSENRLVENLRRKLRKRVSAPSQVGPNAVIAWFLERENILEELRDEAPQIHESMRAVINKETNRLQLTGPPDGTPQHVLGTALTSLVHSLQNEINNLSATTAETMALGTVADWLLRCPLDFAPFDTDA